MWESKKELPLKAKFKSSDDKTEKSLFSDFILILKSKLFHYGRHVVLTELIWDLK